MGEPTLLQALADHLSFFRTTKFSATILVHFPRWQDLYTSISFSVGQLTELVSPRIPALLWQKAETADSLNIIHKWNIMLKIELIFACYGTVFLLINLWFKLNHSHKICYRMLDASPIFSTFTYLRGDRGSTVVKVLCYKSEGLCFDSRWCHWNFSLT